MGNEEIITRNRYDIVHAIGGKRFIANRFTTKLISINDKKSFKNSCAQRKKTCHNSIECNKITKLF